MEFKISKEFIIDAHKAACSDWKKRIESEFPEAFPKLEIGRWYKNGDRGYEKSMACVSHVNPNENDEFGGYGFDSGGRWVNDKDITAFGSLNWIPVTREEVSAALIAEAKKKGYKKGQRIKSFVVGTTLIGSDNDYVWKYFAEENALSYAGAWVFKAGQWAEILPTEKTVVTREKALKILAKKLKVSPENIEIE